ncbi:hypothetical protein JG687_00011369 [Phytophthora cactorum]|uniref:Metallo-beta-lactamase domain-containing protein n=1 Tax=Phytophthora cactorum TaxID=29920 RepID=A0A8T1U7A5_9STRA|nr:hypothetical protein JG687_00011369 [Phytophthora cactorum]
MAPSSPRISQVTAEVVGTGSDGTEPSLLFSVQRHGLYSDDVKVMRRYLFNCGEGTQRLAGENGIKLSSLDAMYFTRFDVKGGKKLVYSGDTKPCNELVLAGMGAELLVHEATFDDSMEEDAKKKKHSTVGQALDIARRMRARQVVLTHFSQRYPSLPPPVSDSSERPRIAPFTVLCAYDGFVHPMPF